MEKQKKKKDFKNVVFLLIAIALAIYSIYSLPYPNSDLFIKLGSAGGILFFIYVLLTEGDWF